MISLFVGILSLLIGIFGLIKNWDRFMDFLFGFLPVSLIIVGIIASIAGVSSIIDNINTKKGRKQKNKI